MSTGRVVSALSLCATIIFVYSSGHGGVKTKTTKCHESRGERLVQDGYQPIGDYFDPYMAAEVNVKQCMGRTCTRVEGFLTGVISSVQYTIVERGCDLLDHTIFTKQKKPADHIPSCNVDRGAIARYYMHKALYTTALQLTNYTRMYAAPTRPLMNTMNECIDLLPEQFPEFAGVVNGTLRVCCCTRRLCNSSVNLSLTFGLRFVIALVFILSSFNIWHLY